MDDLVAVLWFVGGIIWTFNAVSAAWPITIVWAVAAIVSFILGMKHLLKD